MFMAAFRACHPTLESHKFRVPRKLTPESPGMASFRSSRRLPQISSPTSTLTPVMLAPGRDHGRITSSNRRSLRDQGLTVKCQLQT